MLDLTIYKSQYYQVKLDERTILYLEMTKKKQLKTIMSLTKDLNDDDLTVEDIDSLYEGVLIAFNKNKEGRRFSEDQIEEIIVFNSLYAFFDGYYTCVADNLNQKN